MCLQRLIINNKGITTISSVAFNAADRRVVFLTFWFLVWEFPSGELLPPAVWTFVITSRLFHWYRPSGIKRIGITCSGLLETRTLIKDLRTIRLNTGMGFG